MPRVEITVPDDLADTLQPYADRLGELLRLGLQQAKINDALLFYRRGDVSLARAAELADLSREEMIRHARAAGIEPRWSETMLHEELA